MGKCCSIVDGWCWDRCGYFFWVVYVSVLVFGLVWGGCDIIFCGVNNMVCVYCCFVVNVVKFRFG